MSIAVQLNTDLNVHHQHLNEPEWCRFLINLSKNQQSLTRYESQAYGIGYNCTYCNNNFAHLNEMVQEMKWSNKENGSRNEMFNFQYSDYVAFENPLDGSLVLTKNLDYETLKSFQVRILAKDQVRIIYLQPLTNISITALFRF